MKNINGVQVREKLMWYKHEFPDAPYGGMAIGMNFKDYRYKNQMFYEYWYDDGIGLNRYRISAKKAQALGTEYKLKSGVMPNMIPIEEWEIVETRPTKKVKKSIPKIEPKPKKEEIKPLTLGL